MGVKTRVLKTASGKSQGRNRRERPGKEGEEGGGRGGEEGEEGEMIGAKNWTQTFFFSSFSGAARISQQNPRTSGQMDENARLKNGHASVSKHACFKNTSVSKWFLDLF